MKKQPEKPTYRCIDCEHCSPDETNLNYKGEAFMGNCKYERFGFLIRVNYCEKIKLKNK
jgi:hypothetical protein